MNQNLRNPSRLILSHTQVVLLIRRSGEHRRGGDIQRGRTKMSCRRHGRFGARDVGLPQAPPELSHQLLQEQGGGIKGVYPPLL